MVCLPWRLLNLFHNYEIMHVNAHMGIDQFDQPNLLALAYHKIMQVSCNIADLTSDDKVGRDALAEALAYRAMLLLA